MIRDNLKAIGQQLRERVERRLAGDDPGRVKPRTDLVAPERAVESDLAQGAPEPPVVARMMVEIRSDGSTTIARGALVDEASGERVQLEAKGKSPLHLAGQLMKSMLTTPLAAAQFRRSLAASIQHSGAREPAGSQPKQSPASGEPSGGEEPSD